MNKKIIADEDVSLEMAQRSPRKKKLEKDIQREICDYLSETGFFFWRQNNIPVYEKGHFRSLPKYTPRGLPDIILLWNGTFFGFEVKVPGYWKFTNDQKKMGMAINNNGGHYYVVTSLDEVKEKLYGVIV